METKINQNTDGVKGISMEPQAIAVSNGKGLFDGKTRTVRNFLPIRYINELIGIVTEQDFAWPKSLRKDYWNRIDPQTGTLSKVWCPVPAYLMLFKLLIPLRTFQARLLDSGEMDSERFEAGKWVSNTGSLAPRDGSHVAQGCLRKLRNQLTGEIQTAFYINTRKTADRFHFEPGFEIHWQHQPAIEVLESMRNWQEHYNPITSPTTWASLHEKALQRRKNPPTCFLFRDPLGKCFNEPIADLRLQRFWKKLMAELERRLSKRGEKLADGGLPRVAYGLDDVRGTLLLALAGDGRVPLQMFLW